MDIADLLSKLRIKDILEAADKLTIPLPCQRKKSVLASFILGNLTPELEKNLRDKLAT